MVISQGEVWWTDLPEPIGSGQGFRRPVAVIQSDAFNRSRIASKKTDVGGNGEIALQSEAGDGPTDPNRLLAAEAATGAANAEEIRRRAAA